MCPDCKGTRKYIGLNVVEDCHCVDVPKFVIHFYRGLELVATLQCHYEPVTGLIVCEESPFFAFDLTMLVLYRNGESIHCQGFDRTIEPGDTVSFSILSGLA
jgi:hypothetical protein